MMMYLIRRSTGQIYAKSANATHIESVFEKYAKRDVICDIEQYSGSKLLRTLKYEDLIEDRRSPV